MRTRWVALGLTGLMLSAGSAWAEAIVRVNARSDSAAISDNSGNYPALAGEPWISGRASAVGTASSHFETGNIVSCGDGPALAGCVGITGDAAFGRGLGTADGTRGRLRASAVARGSSDSSARGQATLIDTITLSSPIISIDLDINRHSGGASTGSEMDWNASIRFLLFIPGTHPETDPDITLFGLEAFRNPEESFFSYGRLGPTLEIEAVEDTSVPGSFSYDLDLSDMKFLGGKPIPSFFPIGDPAVGTPLELAFELTAAVDCVTDDCFVEAVVENTLYIGLEGASASGYSYEGFTAPPPVGTIPEPASGLLTLGGLSLLAALRRRRPRAAR